MLSFHRGMPLAKVVSGDLRGEEIRIFKGDSEEPDLISDFQAELLDDDFYHNKKFKMNRDEINELKKHLNYNTVPESDKLQQIHKKALKQIDVILRKEVRLENGKLQVRPNTEMVERLFVSGPSGSGKSTFIARFLKEIRINDPEAEIFVISRVSNDPAFKSIKNITYVKIEDALIDEPLTPEEFMSNTGHKVYLVIDDVSTISNKLLRKSLLNFTSDVLECGRHMKLSPLITNHFISNYAETRTILNEATSVCFFPRSGSKNQINRYLKTYAGLGKKEIQKIYSLNTRWIYLTRTYPQAVVYEQGAYLL